MRCSKQTYILNAWSLASGDICGDFGGDEAQVEKRVGGSVSLRIIPTLSSLLSATLA